MTTWVVQAAIIGLFALACGGLVLAWQRGRLASAAIALFVLALVVWVAEFAALAAGSEAVNGFATCSTCAVNDYVSAVAFLVPPLIMALAAAAMLVVMAHRIRVRRAAAREAAG
jgi:hypothetical protein